MSKQIKAKCPPCGFHGSVIDDGKGWTCPACKARYDWQQPSGEASEGERVVMSALSGMDPLVVGEIPRIIARLNAAAHTSGTHKFINFPATMRPDVINMLRELAELRTAAPAAPAGETVGIVMVEGESIWPDHEQPRIPDGTDHLFRAEPDSEEV